MKGKKITSKERIAKMINDPQERKRIFKELLAHLRHGYSLGCFPLLSDVTIRKYMKEYPCEFNQEEFDEALREGQGGWEKIGRDQALGTCMGNSRSWYYNMANRYGWREKAEVAVEHSGGVNVSVVSYASKKALQPIEETEEE